MQLSRRNALAVIGSTTGLLVSGTMSAATPTKQNHTVIYVTDMHCSNCAKRIARKLYTIPGVVKVQTNVKKNYALVIPQKNKKPSPKKMWEAAIAAKLKPLKLVSPEGVFTKAPKK